MGLFASAAGASPALLGASATGLQGAREGLGAEKEFGEHGLALCERVFWGWEVYRHTGERPALQLTIRRLQREYKAIVGGYAAKRARNRHCRGMARNLLKAWPALWTFAKHAGVEPTNNHVSARYAARSSTASSPSPASPRPGSYGQPGCSRHTQPVACRGARCSSNSPRRSAPTREGIPCRCSAERGGGLNAYGFLWVSVTDRESDRTHFRRFAHALPTRLRSSGFDGADKG